MILQMCVKCLDFPVLLQFKCFNVTFENRILEIIWHLRVLWKYVSQHTDAYNYFLCIFDFKKCWLKKKAETSDYTSIFFFFHVAWIPKNDDTEINSAQTA